MELKDLAGLSEPATALINRCSDALGAVFHPSQIVRVAQAEAEAELIRARNRVEVADIESQGAVLVAERQRRALLRLLHEEGLKQENMESVIGRALPQVKEDADPAGIDNDWLTNFFDKCRLISDKEMQFLWGKILAGEANAPGAFSKRIVNLFESLRRKDALDFQTLMRFGVRVEDLTPYVYDETDEIYKNNGISLDCLFNLQSLGLIVHSANGFIENLEDTARDLKAAYFTNEFVVNLGNRHPPEFIAGHVMLTELGRELSAICTPTPIEGFPDYLKGQWLQQGHRVEHINS